jgi:hypothetical protein
MMNELRHAELIEGTRIYYTGDMANADGLGTITKVHAPETKYGYGESVDIRFDDGRESRKVWKSMFEPGPGRRFWSVAEWDAKRALDIEEMKRHYEAVINRRKAQ